MSLLIIAGVAPLSEAFAAPVPAAGYFVDCGGGDDGNAGTSAAPWRTLSKVNSTVSTMSADVWFLAGTTCQGSLSVDWNGTAADHVIVGSYYVSGGVAYQLTPDNPSALAKDYSYSNGSRAVIKGSYNATCSRTLARLAGVAIPSGSCPSWTSSGEWQPQVALACDYCDVQNLSVVESAGQGISNTFTNPLNTYQHHDHIIRDNFIARTAGTGLNLIGTQHDYVYGNYISTVSVSNADGLFNHDAGVSIGCYFNACVNKFNDADLLFEKNEINMVFGEGIIVNRTGGVILRGNRVGTTSAVLVYVSMCVDCVIEYNNVWGGQSQLSGFGSAPAANSLPGSLGIAIYNEIMDGPPYQDTDVVVRGNVVANTSRCLIIGQEVEPNAWGARMSGQFYNNTCVNVSEKVEVGSGEYSALMTAANIGAKGIHFRNNVFYNEPSSGYGNIACQSANLPNVDFDYNLWGTPPADTSCVGSHDAAGDPLLAGSGFNNKTSWSKPPVMDDYVLRSGSLAFAKGTGLTTTILSTAGHAQLSKINYPCATFDLHGSTIDAVCMRRDATNPDLGAVGRNAGQAQTDVYVLTVD